MATPTRVFKLEVLNTQLQGKRVRLKDNLTVGSGIACTVRANASELSEIHARFTLNESGSFTIEVGDPAAHIFLNGRDVYRSELRHHDVLKVGPLRFRVIDEALATNSEIQLDRVLRDYESESENTEEVYDFAKEDLFYLTTKDPELRKRLAFRIPSKDRFIDQAQVFLARLAKSSEMDEMKLDHFMTCCKELILNAHRHGHKFDESRTIVIRYRDLGNALQLMVEDQGSGFDHEKTLSEARNANAAAAARKRYQAGGVGGLGFTMIVKMADTISYNQPGNIVTFTVTKKS